jgi:hypothetical protein
MLKIIRVTIHNLVAQDLCTPVVVYVLLVCDASLSDQCPTFRYRVVTSSSSVEYPMKTPS